MTFAKSYEPGEFESEIYAAWEAAGVFKPSVSRVPTDDDGNGRDDREVLEKVSSRDGVAPARRHGRSAPHTSVVTSGSPRVTPFSSSSTFSIVMPPPNANGNLHIGHGLTVALEDSLTRYYRLRGLSSWYIPGADHAGFETWVVYERFLEKQGHTRFEFSRDELYARVWDFVAEQRGNMELQLRALGASCAWDDLTFTLDENVIDRVYSTFEKMWKDGMIYRGEKLVNFCPKHQTAFADIEVEHKDEKGTLWDIAYKIDGSSKKIIVSTTRPETLFGDAAVAVNPNGERYTDLIGKFVCLPLTDKKIPIIADEHADPAYGTGAVKITPAHDFDDFEVGERHNLPRLQVISESGKMINVPADYEGLSTEECRKKVLKDLKNQNLLRGEKKIVHSVAHCYKCGTTLEPMLKEQWFVDVEKLAAVAIKHLEAGEIKFYPENKCKVLINYLKGLKDWNISRQIPWGIAIPMFKKVDDAATDEPDWIFDRRTNLREIEKGGVRYVRDEDTFDTWFSSSHWPIVCTDWTEENFNPYYPLNVMETGADILFAWVARMIMMGLYVTGEVPFREVYLHGLVLDAHGQKMSKSKGNVINPMELVTRFGSDAFRLGILRGRSAGMNQAFSEDSVIAGRNLCNKLWNISRFVQGIVGEGSEPNTSFASSRRPVVTGGASSFAAAHANAYESSDSELYTTNAMGEDWICREINECLEQVERDMAEYRFAEAVETLYATIWDKYADWFLESQKLFKNVPLLKKTLETLIIALHPFAPFVTEAIWQNLSWTEGFVAAAKWPARLDFDPISAENFENIRTIVSEVRGTLQSLPGSNNAKKYGLLYDNDSLVKDNQMLIKALAKVPTINALDGAPRGLRLALANHELYLDVPEKVVSEYKEALTERILAVGRELDGLNARMMNPNYVAKAPEHLVKETKGAITEKEALIERLKQQLKLV
ncbi:valine--tRNA ligase [Candidatus Saccharibacteria bacterium]|nr:valine--tRNA ligase [Candidatus Saccharibacteria bacterium]